jgi:hypothetical protein
MPGSIYSFIALLADRIVQYVLDQGVLLLISFRKWVAVLFCELLFVRSLAFLGQAEAPKASNETSPPDL